MRHGAEPVAIGPLGDCHDRTAGVARATAAAGLGRHDEELRLGWRPLAQIEFEQVQLPSDIAIRLDWLVLWGLVEEQ